MKGKIIVNADEVKKLVGEKVLNQLFGSCFKLTKVDLKNSYSMDIVVEFSDEKKDREDEPRP